MKTLLELVVLSLLADKGPMSEATASRLVARARTEFGDAFEVPADSIYKAVARMTQNGWLERKNGNPDRQSQPTYTATSVGEAERFKLATVLQRLWLRPEDLPTRTVSFGSKNRIRNVGRTTYRGRRK